MSSSETGSEAGQGGQSGQLTFQDPVKKSPAIEPPPQHQPEPGLDKDMTPHADHGEDSYRGTGRQQEGANERLKRLS